MAERKKVCVEFGVLRTAALYCGRSVIVQPHLCPPLLSDGPSLQASGDVGDGHQIL